MLRNYLIVALRNLWKYKGFSIINIASLAIGITGCLVIALFVHDELRFDKFIKGGENIYRLHTSRTDNQGTTKMAVVPPMFAAYLKQHFPEIDTTLRIMMLSEKLLLEAGEVRSYEENWMPAEPSFFNFFPLKFVSGDPNTALKDPNAVVITEDLARKHFGKRSAIGKVIKVNKNDMVVKGVLANLPAHFHLHFKLLMPLASLNLPQERMQSWGWNQFFTYIKVKPGVDVSGLQSKFHAALQKEREGEWKKSGATFQPFFQPLKNIHLQSADLKFDNARRGNETYVKGLVLIALFVLIIACFNFINLATARSLRRAKEIGVRKVVGAGRRQLLLQFAGEAIILSGFAVLIAAIITWLLMPSLNSFTQKSISFNPVSNPLLGLLLLLAAILIGLLSGTYPALVLSGFKAIRVLKGMKPTGDSNNASVWLREALVVIQFALSALLIVSTTIVYRQMNYLHDKDLGFNKDQVLFFPLRGDVIKNIPALKDELQRSPNIISSTAGYGLPGDVFAGDGVSVPAKDGEKQLPTTLFIGDPDYVNTLGLNLIAGRNFSKELSTDVDEAFIINETAVKEFGFGTPQAALGQRINWERWEKDSLNPVKQGRVIGVVKDFNYSSLHEKVASLVLHQDPKTIEKIAVKIKAADIGNTIAFINATWNKFSPGYPLEYKFLDENFGEMYKSEDRLSRLLSIFTGMAIFVGCMGLFGLAAFTAEQRTKEIGIRKVLGASVMGIVTMLSKTFLKPVLIASLIAFPIAWWAMNTWLQDFEYRVSITWRVFGIAALVALLIALVTVSFQTIKAAISNPIKSLRTE
ncbi:MAG TPA: ABC transporter permease [Chitinophagaceae bacterium]|nr:ABC transporter permease [Chitinophagaceae bacterium]